MKVEKSCRQLDGFDSCLRKGDDIKISLSSINRKHLKTKWDFLLSTAKENKRSGLRTEPGGSPAL